MSLAAAEFDECFSAHECWSERAFVVTYDTTHRHRYLVYAVSEYQAVNRVQSGMGDLLDSAEVRCSAATNFSASPEAVVDAFE